MKTRGESSFAKLPRPAAWMFDALMSGRGADEHYAGIARDVVARAPMGQLLDVGTGPGRLLGEIAKLAPRLQLQGLDISAAMVERAARRLGNSARIMQGSAAQAPFPNCSFETVVCSGSFYQWDQPVRGLDEIYRLLVPGSVAYLYETSRDCDRAALRAAIADKLANEGLLLRKLRSYFLLKQFDMTYSIDEFRSLIDRSRFAGSYSLETIALAKLPGWLRIELKRRTG
jgi:ubiquinone/menaquinone biosynthesis C-methylase UbiE